MNFSVIKQKRDVIFVFSMLFLFTGCWEFLSVNRPDLADPDSSFDVPITIALGAEGEGGVGYFGILLPIGWTPEDSISYAGIHNGTFIYSSAQSDSMEAFDSAPCGYYWRAFVSDSVDSLLEGKISFTPKIHTDNQTGLFLLDYMFTDRYEQGRRRNFVIRSGYKPITVGLSGSALVTNINDSGEGSLRNAVKNVGMGGSISFDLEYPTVILLDSQLVVDRNVTITGPESAELIISVSDTARVFYIEENLKSVNISNLTISNGSGEYEGGGIYCAGSNLSLTKVTISNNSAVIGGGIWFGACGSDGGGG